MTKTVKILAFVLIIILALVGVFIAFKDKILALFAKKTTNNVANKGSNTTASTSTGASTTVTDTIPGVVTGLTASATPGATNLIWTAPTTGSPPTGYKVMRRTGANAYAQIGNTVVAPLTAYSDTTGVTGTVYDYNIVATNGAGDGTASNIATATAQAATTVPNPATSLTVTAAPGAISLAWLAPASGFAPTGYRVMRRTGANAYAQIGNTIAAPERTYIDTTGAAGTTYDYQIVALNAIGNATASNTASASAQAVVTVPNAPTGLTATAAPGTTNLAWVAPATGSAPTAYKVMRRTGTNAYAQVGGNVAFPTAVFVDTTGVAGTSYDYQIIPINGVGSGAASNTASATAQAVSVTLPGAATLAGQMFGNLPALTWTAPASGPAPTGYKLYRSSNPTTGFTQIKDTTELFWNDAGAPSATFYYKVVTYNTLGTGATSNVVMLVIP